MTYEGNVERLQDGEIGRWASIKQRIGDGVRVALGTVLVQPEGYLYPGDVREKAADIQGLVPTLGGVSTATAAQRTSIVSEYEPRQVTGLIRDSEEMQWTARPGFYSALANRVTRETGVESVLYRVPKPNQSRTNQQVPVRKKKHSRADRRRLTIVKDD